jgi:hypothetical protein
MKIKASQFVKRQTPQSEFSHYNGSWEEVEQLVEDHFDQAKPGYRDGVILVNVPPAGFFSSLVKMTADLELETVFAPRREGEPPYQKTIAYGKKSPATAVTIVLYQKEVLEQDELNTADLTGADWEIVSVNAHCLEVDEIPMHPLTMARNQFADRPEGQGGTKANYSADQFAESILFWQSHIQVRERI